MKRLKGFTLAEMLITLAILGVVAAMTIPPLNTSVQKNQVGPSLKKAMNTLTTGLQLLKASNNIRDLASVGDVPSYVFHVYVAQKIRLTPRQSTVYSANSYGSYKYFNPEGKATWFQAKRFSTPDNIDYFIKKDDDTWHKIESSFYSRAYNGKFVFLLVDSNGYDKNPNTEGKDLFKFIIDTAGTVIPYGGSEASNYLSGGETSTPLWETLCNSTSISDPFACTGSIFENDGNVIYKW